MNHSKPHLRSVHAKVCADASVAFILSYHEAQTLYSLQCGATTAVFAVSASAGGLIAFRKMGLIHMFPERMHKTLKWIHRNVRVAALSR